jgi:hypothetical protein
MRMFAVLASCLAAGAAHGDMFYMRRAAFPLDGINMVGRWRLPTVNGQQAEIIVTADHRASLVVTRPGLPATVHEAGYVWVEDSTVQIIFTERFVGPNFSNRLHCGVRSNDLINCQSIKGGNPFMLSRVER